MFLRVCDWITEKYFLIGCLENEQNNHMLIFFVCLLDGVDEVVTLRS